MFGDLIIKEIDVEKKVKIIPRIKRELYLNGILFETHSDKGSSEYDYKKLEDEIGKELKNIRVNYDNNLYIEGKGFKCNRGISIFENCKVIYGEEVIFTSNKVIYFNTEGIGTNIKGDLYYKPVGYEFKYNRSEDREEYLSWYDEVNGSVKTAVANTLSSVKERVSLESYKVICNYIKSFSTEDSLYCRGTFTVANDDESILEYMGDNDKFYMIRAVNFDADNKMVFAD